MKREPKKPDWKLSRNEAEKLERIRFGAASCLEEFPKMEARFSWLKDRDAQLYDLCDYAQSIGVPLGGSHWATQIKNLLMWFEGHRSAVGRFFRDYSETGVHDLQRLSEDLEHQRLMHAKRHPVADLRECCWCGYRDKTVRFVGDGMNACSDCLPEETTNHTETMGTNYYLHRNVCPHCDKTDDILHIGKSSVDWTFALHVMPEDGIQTLDDWRKLIQDPKNKVIDEYSDQLTPEYMLNIIQDRGRAVEWDAWAKTLTPEWGYTSEQDFHAKNGSERGQNSLIRRRIDGRRCIGHGEGTWDYITGEFS